MAVRGWLGGRFGGWIVVALIYAGLNGVLYVGQEVLSRDDEREAERIGAELVALDQEIDQVSLWLESKAQLSDAIDALGAQLDQGGSYYASTTSYDADRVRFNQEVDKWNAEYDHLLAEAARHEQLLEQYNELVDQYNTVAEAAYSRWWLLPIPAPRRAASSASR